MNDTKGTAVVTTEFLEYQEHKGPLETSRKGAIISTVDGVATAYGIKELEMHGTMFVKHGTKVRNFSSCFIHFLGLQRYGHW